MADNEKVEQPVQAKKDKKDKKPDKNAKPGFFARVGKYFRDMKSELKNVQWLTRKQTINNTLIVIACVLVVGVFIWLFDFIANNGIRLLMSLLG